MSTSPLCDARAADLATKSCHGVDMNERPESGSRNHGLNVRIWVLRRLAALCFWDSNPSNDLRAAPAPASYSASCIQTVIHPG
jgi:hypothetical protein